MLYNSRHSQRPARLDRYGRTQRSALSVGTESKLCKLDVSASAYVHSGFRLHRLVYRHFRRRPRTKRRCHRRLGLGSLRLLYRPSASGSHRRATIQAGTQRLYLGKDSPIWWASCLGINNCCMGSLTLRWNVRNGSDTDRRLRVESSRLRWQCTIAYIEAGSARTSTRALSMRKEMGRIMTGNEFFGRFSLMFILFFFSTYRPFLLPLHFIGCWILLLATIKRSEHTSKFYSGAAGFVFLACGGLMFNLWVINTQFHLLPWPIYGVMGGGGVLAVGLGVIFLLNLLTEPPNKV